MLRIIIADDHPVVRKGLMQIIHDENQHFYKIDEAGSGPELLKKISHNKYDLILLDISMPGMNGLEVMEEIKKKESHPPVLILSIPPEEQYAVRALKSGASGYLNKNSSSTELMSAIKALVAGKRYISKDISNLLVDYLDTGFSKPHENLTNREHQIMLLIASGKKLTEIADTLSLSIKTVSTHKSNILRKMNLNSNADLARYAIDNKLLS